MDDSDLAELGADSVRELVDKSAHALVSICHGQSTATKIYVSVHTYSWHSYPWLRFDALNIDLSHSFLIDLFLFSSEKKVKKRRFTLRQRNAQEPELQA